jgi:hypothetical protein
VKQRAIFATVVAMALAAPSLALAQGGPGLLPPYEVLTILRSTGLDPIGQPARRGGQYVLRAVDTDGTHVRVVVDARMGEILSVTPVVVGPRPSGPVVRRYEPEAPDGYVPPAPRVYREPPSVYDDEPPRRIYRPGPPGAYDDAPPAIESRPLAPVPSAPPPVIAATPDGAGPAVARATPPQPPGEPGLLPPPPERFPQRVPPTAAKPQPSNPAAVKRTAALPKQPPLPKPRPGTGVDAAPLPPEAPKAKPEGGPKPEGQSMPH